MDESNQYTNESEKRYSWLASLLMRRDSKVWPRYARLIERLARRTRGWRRPWQRRLVTTLTGAGLLLALAGFGAWAAPDNVITVANGEVVIANNGKCSLGEAIITANDTDDGRPISDCAAGNPGGADSIILPAGGIFTVTGVEHPSQKYGATGLPWIESTVTIEGNGATIQRPFSADDFRLMAVSPTGNLDLKNVTLSGGYAHLYSLYYSGGSYYYYAGMGGGILNMGALTLTGATVRDNVAYSYDNSGMGGGIANLDTLVITASNFLNNTATGAYGGVGGGIWTVNSLTILNSTVSGNRATGEYTSGGGIRNLGYLEIDGTQLIYNAATGYTAWGGGIDNSYYAIITNSLIAANSAGSGSYSDGYAYGGGINNGYVLEMTNTTVSGNVMGRGAGGGINNLYQATITNSTITDNSNDGIDAGCTSADDEQKTMVRRSIVSGNAGHNIDKQDPLINYAGCQPIVTLDSHNLLGYFGDAATRGVSPGFSDIVPSGSLGSILGVLGAHGGPTWSHALPAGSPAIDRAPSSACSAAPVGGVDQRGQPRNRNGDGASSANECDIGAYEFQPQVLPDTPTFTSTPTATATLTATPTPTPTRTVTPLPEADSRAFVPLAIHVPATCFPWPDEREPNNIQTEANGPLCNGQTYHGRPGDDYDVYYFDMPAAGPIAIELNDFTVSKGQLGLLSASFTPIAYDLNPADGFRISRANEPTGRYYVVVHAPTPDVAAGPYTLRATFATR